MKVMLDNGAIAPTRAHDVDAGLDLYTPKMVRVTPGESDDWYGTSADGFCLIDTGVHVQIPKGYVGMVKSKSGLNIKHGLTAEGVIDCGYTGSIMVKMYNHTKEDYVFNVGDKIAQLVIMPCELCDVELVDSLEETERGNNGFGSTGR